ncbi:Prolyl-tRNA synthetase associated domain-containing protein, partial [Dysosmobacter welbionis]
RRLPPDRIQRSGGRFHRHHRRRRRPHRYLRHCHAGSGPAGPHRRVGVLLHGPGAGDPAAHYEAADHRGRAQDRHEAPAGGLQEGKDRVPHRGDRVRCPAGALRGAADRLFDAGQPVPGVRRHRPAQQDGAERAHQHRHHLPGGLRGRHRYRKHLPQPPDPGHHGHGHRGLQLRHRRRCA